MDCKFDEGKGGWIPVKVAYNKKRPDLISRLKEFTQKTQQ